MKEMRRLNKRAAMELSIGTIVVIVLAVTMLILGLVLIRTIFTGAKYNVEILDQKVKEQINKLFVEDARTVVYLAKHEAVVKQGETWGIAWAVKNLETGTVQSAKLSYNVIISDTLIRQNCGISEQEAEKWITQGKSESNIPLPPGQVYPTITRIRIPETAPLCTIRFRIETKLDGNDYATDFFDVNMGAK